VTPYVAGFGQVSDIEVSDLVSRSTTGLTGSCQCVAAARRHGGMSRTGGRMPALARVVSSSRTGWAGSSGGTRLQSTAGAAPASLGGDGQTETSWPRPPADEAGALALEVRPKRQLGPPPGLDWRPWASITLLGRPMRQGNQLGVFSAASPGRGRCGRGVKSRRRPLSCKCTTRSSKPVSASIW